MKNLLISVCLLFSIQSPAYFLNADQDPVLSSTEIRKQCSEMTSNHMDDIQQLNALYAELRKTTENNNLIVDSDKISDLIGQIKIVSARIQSLARPEWNSETIPLKLVWTLHHHLFFDDSKYLKLLEQVENGYPKLGELLQHLLYRKNEITDKVLLKAEFLNSESQDVSRYLSLAPVDVHASDYDRVIKFNITYKKNVTLLEACQFLNTLVFHVEIFYEHYLGSKAFKDSKTIILFYKYEDPL